MDNDAKYVALAKAIAKKESDGRFNLTGDNGTSYGLGQWNNLGKPLAPGQLPAVWKEHAQKVLGNPNAPMTPENQKTVLTGMVKYMAEVEKLQPYQIAAKWNSGSEKNWENKQGVTIVNGKPLKYDTVGYVKTVDQYFKENMAALNAGQPLPPTTPLPEKGKASFFDPMRDDIKQKIASDSLVDNAVGYMGKIGLGVAEFVGADKPMAYASEKALIDGVGIDPTQTDPNYKRTTGLQAAAGAAQTGLTLYGGGLAGQLGSKAGLLGKIGIGAAEGYGFDVTSKLADGETDTSKALTPGFGTAVGAAIPIVGATVNKVLQPAVTRIKTNVLDDFTRAVKPTSVGKNSATAIESYNNKAFDALKTIAENKQNLKFVTEDGIESVGRNPKTLGELGEAVLQTKQAVFNKYNTLARATGKETTLGLDDVVKELDSFINNEAKQLSSPEAVSYAEKLRETYKGRQLTADVAQEVIQDINKSLQTAYRTGNFTQKNAVDALLANRLREGLDDIVTKATGKEYQALKNQYSSLKSVEKDIAKRVSVANRLQPKGLIDYTDIFTAGDLGMALASGNMGYVAKAGIQQGIKSLYKYKNSPDRAIKNIFKALENYQALPIKNPTQNVTNSIISDIVAQPAKKASVREEVINSMRKAPPAPTVIPFPKAKPTVQEYSSQLPKATNKYIDRLKNIGRTTAISTAANRN